MPTDARQERGRLLAQVRQIRHIEGSMWFVPSQNAGGYLVNVAAGTCSCPDYQQHPVKCKHLWAIEFVQGAIVKTDSAPPALETGKVQPRAILGGRRGDFTKEEQNHVRAALKFLRTRCGGWESLAKGIRSTKKALTLMAYGRPPNASLALRLSRFAGVPMEDVLGGKYPPAGMCPHCGREPETGSLELPVSPHPAT